MAVSLDFKSAYSDIPNNKEALLFSHLQEDGQYKPAHDPTFWLTDSTRDINKNYKTHLHYWKMGITLMLYLNNILTLPESCMQARRVRQRAGSLLQILSFILSLDKYQYKPSQVFTYLGLTFDTREMTISLPLDMVQAINTPATKVVLYCLHEEV